MTENKGYDKNFYDAEEHEAEEKAKKEEMIARIKRLDDIRWILSNAKGRRFLWWVLELCGVFRASYVSRDSNQTAFNEGNRDIGIRVLATVQAADSKAYSQMQDEHLAEQGKKKKEI